MKARTIGIQEAKEHLEELVQRVAGGEEVFIASGRSSVVKLMAVRGPARVFGQYRGRIRISDDFDAPLPEAFWLGKDT